MSKLVTLEQAKKLKDLGYRKDTTHQYKYNDIGRLMEHGSSERMYNIGEEWDAPSISEALEWFREEKGICCGVSPICRTLKYHGVTATNDGYIESTKEYSTHSEAESELLDALIEYVSK